MKDSHLEYFEISSLLTILEKNLCRTSAVSSSVLTQIYFIACHDLIRKLFYCPKTFVIKDILFI